MNSQPVSDTVRFWFFSAYDFQIEPKIEYYGCMVDLLKREGLHKTLELGEKIADFLVNNGQANSGTYVLASNIYAAVGNWKEVNRARALMKQNGVQKEPGCSISDVDYTVHEFVASNSSHPKTKEIYSMLDELNKLLKAHGYILQIELVLHDHNERERFGFIARD